MNSFINESSFPIYILSSETNGKNFAMVATWVMTASLREDEFRFTVAFSKFNDTTKAILDSKKFIIQTIPESESDIAFEIGTYHSLTTDKFSNEHWTRNSDGTPYLKNNVIYAEAELISFTETEDRYLGYCRTTLTKKNSKVKELTHGKLFELLSKEKREILSQKFIEDTNRDTPN